MQDKMKTKYRIQKAGTTVFQTFPENKKNVVLFSQDFQSSIFVFLQAGKVKFGDKKPKENKLDLKFSFFVVLFLCSCLDMI